MDTQPSRETITENKPGFAFDVAVVGHDHLEGKVRTGEGLWGHHHLGRSISVAVGTIVSEVLQVGRDPGPED